MIVRFKDPAGASIQRTSALAKVGGSFEDRDGDGVYDRFAHLDRAGRLMKVDLTPAVSVEAALAELRKDPAVAYVEPNYRLRLAAQPSLQPSLLPDDPRFSELYGLDNRGQTGGLADADIDAVEAWETSTGSSDIVVGVVDTGVDYGHVDLAANMWVNPGETPGNGLDDDGNGIVDDVHGFNAITGGGDPMDDHGHGTHCAGTIGAVGGNGAGVVGVNWQVSLMALKFLDDGGSGTLADAISAIDYALGMRGAGVNLRVLSNSWAGGGFSQALEDAIEEANQRGILVVAAAGNNFGGDNDRYPTYPASYEAANVVSVAATTHTDALAEFSSIGATSVDLGAPGEEILSTIPGDSYAFLSGTSMATPHVAGAAALLLSANRALSTPQLKEILLSSGDAIPALAGTTLSGKRLNVARALAAAGPSGPHFELRMFTRRATLAQEEAGSFAVDVAAFSGFDGDVALAVAATPPIDAALAITPAMVHTRGAAALNVQTSRDTAPGTYQLTVTGTSGALVRTVQVSLRVLPFGAIEESHASADTPLPFSDHQIATSTISVARSFTVQSVQVEVRLSHPDVADLLVELISPAGTEVRLHDLEFHNPSRRYAIPAALAGQLSAGEWKLRVSDLFGDFEEELGELTRWSLHLSNQPSQATFTVSIPGLESWTRQGDEIDMPVHIGSVEGFSGFVAYWATASPAFNGDLRSFSSPVRPPAGGGLSVRSSCATAVGVYDVTVFAQHGALVKTATSKLTVLPRGSQLAEADSTDTPRRIPDGVQGGISSSVFGWGMFPASQLSVDVDISHPAIGQLTVQLISPTGATVTLHDRTGGDEDGLRRTYDLPQLVAATHVGYWRLQVIDHSGGGTGRLERWRFRATETQLIPNASFFFNASDLSVEMQNFSRDAEGCDPGFIVGSHWDFGDGTTSTEHAPTHVYARGGTYQVTLTVTDNEGHTDSETQEVIVTPAPELKIERIVRSRVTSRIAVDLSWRGAAGEEVELQRNDQPIAVTGNDGAHRDSFTSPQTSFTWRLCQTELPGCSNQVSVVLGSAADTAELIGASGAVTRTMRVVEE